MPIFKRNIEYSGLHYRIVCFLIVCSALIILIANLMNAWPQTNPRADTAPTPQARIIVNVPAFKLYFYRGDQLIKSFPVTIGSPDYSSPYGVAREAVEIVWNPRWTPPASDWARNDRPAAPGAANNPLGLLKIRMANFPFLIHGGGDRSINHAVSHGCVRLRNADALALARLIIDACQLNISDKQIARYLADRHREHSAPIKSLVTVEFHYNTITVEDGQLNIYPDIYHEQTNTVEQLIFALYQAGIDFNSLAENERDVLIQALQSGRREKLALSAAPRQ